jgi:hypothetical protein
MPNIGTCFQIIPEGSNHFWIVISKAKSGQVLAVNLTDSENCQSPCHFEVNEHPTIVKPSCVFYKKANVFSAEKIDSELEKSTTVRKLDDFSPELVKRIIEGARSAEDLTLKFLKFLD